MKWIMTWQIRCRPQFYYSVALHHNTSPSPPLFLIFFTISFAKERKKTKIKINLMREINSKYSTYVIWGRVWWEPVVDPTEMAKTGVFDSDPTAIAKAKELKREMRKLLTKIEDEDDLGIQTIDQLQEALSALREATMRKIAKSSSLQMLETVSCPEEFRCPLSKELMRDPVVLASGQVSERHIFISIFF